MDMQTMSAAWFHCTADYQPFGKFPYTGALYYGSGAFPYGAALKGEVLKGSNGYVRSFKTADAAHRAIIAASKTSEKGA